LSNFCEKQGIKIFNEVIKTSVRIMEAPTAGTPIVELYPDLDGAKAYQQVAQEILYG
jgi:cellulose biosynthesis protein BcsQ